MRFFFYRHYYIRLCFLCWIRKACPRKPSRKKGIQFNNTYSFFIVIIFFTFFYFPCLLAFFLFFFTFLHYHSQVHSPFCCSLHRIVLLFQHSRTTITRISVRLYSITLSKQFNGSSVFSYPHLPLFFSYYSLVQCFLLSFPRSFNIFLIFRSNTLLIHL